MKFRNISFLALMLFVSVITNGKAETDSDKEKTTSKEEVTTKKPVPPNIKESPLCKKCDCNLDTSLLDCTKKLGDWFSDEEWKLLINADTVFDTIKLEQNNITKIPILPKYDVKNLYLANNLIDSIAIAAFANLTQLTTLDLSSNKLESKDLKPDVFKGQYTPSDYQALEKLKSLNLGNNDLHSLDADLFEHTPNIEELVLSSNPFQSIDTLTETAISGLSSLKTLDLSYMEIETLPETILHGPRELETLIAEGNLFKELPKALSYAKNLVRLVLNDNPIANLEGENVFPAMTNLRYLSMSYMQELRKIGSGAFSELQNLTELILSDDKLLSEIDENAFSKNVTGGQYLDYPPLEQIHLKNCNLTTIPRNLIVRYDKLQALDLRYNPWSCYDTNKHLITILMPQVNKKNPIYAKDVQCAVPEKLKNVELLTVSKENSMESTNNSSLVWVGLLVAVLIAVPIIMGGVVAYRRGCFGVFRRKDNAGSRALYNRASFNEDFHI